MNNSDGSNLCWCYSHFLKNGFSAMIWRQQRGGDAVLLLEWGAGVAGGGGSVARPMWKDGGACAGLPQLRCILLAACLACSSSSTCSRIFNAQPSCSGKRFDSVISELHQTTLHVAQESTSKKEPLIPPWAQFFPPACLFTLPSNAYRRACLSPFSCLIYNNTPFY